MYNVFDMCMHIMIRRHLIGLFSQVTTIESKLSKNTNQIAQVPKSYNENTKSIQSLNSMIFKFMQQF
jgi:hypothetical protein